MFRETLRADAKKGNILVRMGRYLDQIGELSRNLLLSGKRKRLC